MNYNLPFVMVCWPILKKKTDILQRASCLVLEKIKWSSTEAIQNVNHSFMFQEEVHSFTNLINKVSFQNILQKIKNHLDA